jgi:ribulose-bisphosphate carboxylase large chain
MSEASADRTRLTAVYRIRSAAASIVARAQALAVEQSVEMPISAIDDADVLDGIVGRVEAITEIGDDLFEVRIALAAASIGDEAGQLLNMLFGNSSLQDDVSLHDVVLPDAMIASFGGPNAGTAGLRQRAGAVDRALACSALKPQGLTPAALAELAGRLARGGLDFIKDDHGIAEQRIAPFASRVPAVASAIAAANAATGGRTRYVPSVSGSLDDLRRQVAIARGSGVDTLLVAPMLVGLPAFHTLARENPDMAMMAHPAMAGAARIAPPLLLGRLFRLLGADAVIFPNHGGRFGYTAAVCHAIAANAGAAWTGAKPSLPVPAGGMTVARVPEMLDFYGRDVMLLIGGSLLAARERLTEETAAFAALVRQHRFR